MSGSRASARYSTVDSKPMNAAKQMPRTPGQPGLNTCSGRRSATLMPCAPPWPRMPDRHQRPGCRSRGRAARRAPWRRRRCPGSRGTSTAATAARAIDRPRHLSAEDVVEHVLGLDGEEAVDADLQAVVGDDRQHARRPVPRSCPWPGRCRCRSRRPPSTCRVMAMKPTAKRVSTMPAQRGSRPGRRCRRRDGHRGNAGHDGQRRCRRDDQEDDAAGAEHAWS